MKRWPRLRWALCLATLAACHEEAGNVSGIFLEVAWEPAALSCDQLQVQLLSDGALVAGPALRPESPSATLTPPQSMRLLVADTLAGKTIELRVDALLGGNPTGSGTTAATVSLGAEIDARLLLSSAAAPAPAPAAATPPPVAPVSMPPMVQSGCPSCAGCCDANDTCTPPSADRCGANGSACVSCAPRGDTCKAGVCACGEGGACAQGQHCLGGACVCDSASCPSGCCDAAGTCRDGATPEACGAGGQGCEACPKVPARAGPLCVGGVCVGCRESCRDGCCSGATCRRPSAQSCGIGGVACQSCVSALADRCDAGGQCRCGELPPCAEGQHCAGGACVCDAESCAGGCCSMREGGVCFAGTGASACGSGGNLCLACPVNCDPATRSCRGCGPANCSGGNCCDGDSCWAQGPSDGVLRCGVAGSACTFCSFDQANGCTAAGGCSCSGGASCSGEARCTERGCETAVDPCTLVSCELPASNHCSLGQCLCGAGPPCASGLRCTGTADVASCVCDAESGCGGCCDPMLGCVAPEALHSDLCGSFGAACASCSVSNGVCTSGACACAGTPESCGVWPFCVACLGHCTGELCEAN